MGAVGGQHGVCAAHEGQIQGRSLSGQLLLHVDM